MPKPRYAQIVLEQTPYYHCTTRCVRQAFLCGHDESTGRVYDHRRDWIEERLLTLGKIFAIHICAYAVMSNHYHVVLHVDQPMADAWNDAEVITRWHSLFRGHELTHKYLKGLALSAAERRLLDEIVAEWRKRLMDISWFMRILNESIARKANAEDGCKGRFWEARFHCQALLDEQALAACMAYVDLNPVRACIAETPEDSDYTSIQTRVRQALKIRDALGWNEIDDPEHQPDSLVPFAGNPTQDMPNGLPFHLSDYLSLVDWTGRQIREDKPGHIRADYPHILTRLGIKPEKWLIMTSQFESRFKCWIGISETVRRICRKLGYTRSPGIGACVALMPG